MSSESKPAHAYAIRHATREDVPEILRLIQELALYEHSPSAVEATPTKLLSTLSFAPSSQSPADGEPAVSATRPARALLLVPLAGAMVEGGAAGALGAEEAEGPRAGSRGEPRAVGLALYFYSYSTWRAAPGIYLEDLYVREECRGRGYGRALLGELAREVVEMGGGRLEWSVLRWNEPSIGFYESEAVGAVGMTEWMGMRVEREALVRLAGLEGVR